MCEREATLQVRPVELLCDASHELPKRVMGPELFLDVPKKRYVPRWSCIPLCDWVTHLSNSGSILSACTSKISVYGRLLFIFPSFFPFFRHESLSQGLFPPPGRLVIYTVPRVKPRNNPFFASGTYCQNLTGDR